MSISQHLRVIDVQLVESREYRSLRKGVEEHLDLKTTLIDRPKDNLIL